MAELGRIPGAVDLDRVIEVLVDRGQARGNHHVGQWPRRPDLDDEHGPEGVPAQQPERVPAQMERAQRVVDEPARVEEQGPAEHGRHHPGDDVGDQEPGPHQAPPAEAVVDRDRDENADRGRHRRCQQRERRAHPQGVRGGARHDVALGQGLDVVLQSREGGRVPRLDGVDRDPEEADVDIDQHGDADQHHQQRRRRDDQPDRPAADDAARRDPRPPGAGPVAAPPAGGGELRLRPSGVRVHGCRASSVVGATGPSPTACPGRSSWPGPAAA